MAVVINLEFAPGDFHCRDCDDLCNYIHHAYCCDNTRQMTPQTKKCNSHFLKMCAYRLRLERIIEAFAQGKKMVHPDGSCVFCRNKKYHNQLKWCETKSPLQLYMQISAREQATIESLLESFLSLRVSSKMEMVSNLQKRILREMKQALVTSNAVEPAQSNLSMFQYRRVARETYRKEEERIVAQNRSLRHSLLGVLRTRKAEHIAALQNMSRSG